LNTSPNMHAHAQGVGSDSQNSPQAESGVEGLASYSTKAAQAHSTRR
jgi:hypothetical protein